MSLISAIGACALVCQYTHEIRERGRKHTHTPSHHAMSSGKRSTAAKRRLPARQPTAAERQEKCAASNAFVEELEDALDDEIRDIALPHAGGASDAGGAAGARAERDASSPPRDNPRWKGKLVEYLLCEVLPEVEERDGGSLYENDIEEWKRWHSAMEQRHQPASAMVPRMFRAMLMGAVPSDKNVVQLLIARYLVEKGKLKPKESDELVAAHQTITHMYPPMRANVERVRAKRAAAAATTTATSSTTSAQSVVAQQ